MEPVFVLDAVRSPRTKGRPGGALASVLPHQLVAQLVHALRERNGVEAVDSAESLHLSSVGQIGAQGGHIALVSKLEAELPHSTTAQSINNYCVGGLTAVGTSFAAIGSGQIELGLAGGVEMMSHVAFLADGASLYTDTDVSSKLRWAPVGVAADHLAIRHGIERDQLDALAVRSHTRAAEAWAQGRYNNQVVAIETADGVCNSDETIKPDMTVEDIAALDPVFDAPGRSQFDAVIADDGQPIEHRHTIAHCPPIADGASLVLLGSAAAAERHGLEPLARIDAIAELGGDPVIQLTAGRPAMNLALERAGASLSDMDVVEYMEAFAVVPALFEREAVVDPDIVNPNGGHLAMGHPMGATGAILATALAHHLAESGGHGVAVAHGGSGVGAAIVMSAV